MWAGIGGSTVHRVTEMIDLGDERGINELWSIVWQECYDEAVERSPQYEPSEYYRSGRASKDWPEKETPEWWSLKGPEFIKQWIMWRDNCGLKIWEYPDEDGELKPAVEVEVWAYGPEDLQIRSIIDRVYVNDAGELYIVDLKTGSHTDAWPRQMAYNALGVLGTFEVQPRWAGFWKARSGGVPEWFDLSVFTEEWLWEQAWKAREIRDQQLFLAVPGNLCKSACGVARFCVAMGGTPFFRKPDATLTHNEGDKQ